MAHFDLAKGRPTALTKRGKYKYTSYNLYNTTVEEDLDINNKIVEDEVREFVSFPTTHGIMSTYYFPRNIKSQIKKGDTISIWGCKMIYDDGNYSDKIYIRVV